MIATRQREKFDINNPQHVQYFREFFATNKWGPHGCPFRVEYPWISATAMISDKIVAKFLGLDAQQGETKFTRTSTNEETNYT